MLMTERLSEEMHTDAVAASRRLQPYRLIHKALRALMFRTLQRVAALDAGRAEDRMAMAACVDELLQVCADHLAHENQFFHEPLRNRAERAPLPFDDDHSDHERAIAALRERLHQLGEAGAAARAQGYALYLALTRFVGENLDHMAAEETRMTQALWQHFSDEEIQALEDQLRATFSQQESAYYLRWMVRAVDDEELRLMASEIRAQMPADAFQGFFAAMVEELEPARRARLARALGMAPVPGLVEA